MLLCRGRLLGSCSRFLCPKSRCSLPWPTIVGVLLGDSSKMYWKQLTRVTVENISRIMARYRLFEVLYLRGAQSELELKLEEALSGLYAEILVHLGSAVKFFEERSTSKCLKIYSEWG